MEQFDFNGKKMYLDEDVLRIKNEARRYEEEQRLAAEGIFPSNEEGNDEEENDEEETKKDGE